MDRRTEEGKCRRLSSGLDELEQWSERASQVERNAVYRALFAVVCGSIFHSHEVIRCAGRSEEFIVLVRTNLTIRIRFRHADAFGIAYIGPPQPLPE